VLGQRRIPRGGDDEIDPSGKPAVALLRLYRWQIGREGSTFDHGGVPLSVSGNEALDNEFLSEHNALRRVLRHIVTPR